MPDTIYARASGTGRAGVAVIRLSGPDTAAAVTALTAGRVLPPPRLAVRRTFVDPVDGSPLDDGLLIWFPGPASYTGEDVAELHTHGGHAVITAFYRALGAMEGLRLAEPGEFTRRAFDNDRIDLTEAEGIIDLIDAETDAQRRQALRQAEGALGRLYDGWAKELVPLLAHIEAEIDFPDEDLPPDIWRRNADRISDLADRMAHHLKEGAQGERLRSGVRVAIIGPPNAGKSSLLNWLAKRDAAIVSDRAGTTRDVIEVHLDLGGYPVILADTAGLRETSDEIEDEGIRRARMTAESADLRLVVVDSADPDAIQTINHLTANDPNALVIVNKIDSLHPNAFTPDTPASDVLSGSDTRGPVAATPPLLQGDDRFAVSLKTEAGLDRFMVRLKSLVKDRAGLTGEPVFTRERHRQAVSECLDALIRAVDAPVPELAAEDLRLAVRALGRITGRVDVEDLLDIIFRDFCIGK